MTQCNWTGAGYSVLYGQFHTDFFQLWERVSYIDYVQIFENSCLMSGLFSYLFQLRPFQEQRPHAARYAPQRTYLAAHQTYIVVY